jgi:hypothetical protein
VGGPEELLAQMRAAAQPLPDAVLEPYVRYGTKRRDDGRLVWKRDPNLVKGFVETELWRYVREIKAPILYVLGGRSTIVPPATQEELKKVLPQARIVTMPGLGHYPSDEKPEEFVKIVDEFPPAPRPRELWRLLRCGPLEVCSERWVLSSVNASRRVSALDQAWCPRANRAPLGHRFEVEDRIPVLGAVEMIWILSPSFSVCISVRISNISSSVPKPPGKTTSAFARYANQNLRMKSSGTRSAAPR